MVARFGTGLPSAMAQPIAVRATKNTVVEWLDCLLAVWPSSTHAESLTPVSSHSVNSQSASLAVSW